MSTLKRIGRKGFGALLAAMLLTELLSACSFGGRIYTSQLFAMNTIMELQVVGHEETLAEAEAMIRDLEQELSVTDERSSVYALNESGSAEFSPEAAQILQGALEVCERTGGALDVSIYPVLKAWGFTTGEYRVPAEDEIQALLEDVDYRKIQVTGDQGDGMNSIANSDDVSADGETAANEENLTGNAAGGNDDGEATAANVTIPAGMQIDLGSVVKGYTGTAVADYLREQGVTSALINLGGNVQCIGKKPTGEKWKVAIKSPFENSSTGIFGVIEAADTAIITSGGYERYFEEDGQTYWHILDPETGYPAKSGLASVTIIGDNGLVCDGLSTALFVMGLDRAIELWRASSDFEAVFITETGDVYITEGISDSFSLSGEYYDASITVISN